jgi:hypothetical protein
MNIKTKLDEYLLSEEFPGIEIGRFKKINAAMDTLLKMIVQGTLKTQPKTNRFNTLLRDVENAVSTLWNFSMNKTEK